MRLNFSSCIFEYSIFGDLSFMKRKIAESVVVATFGEKFEKVLLLGFLKRVFDIMC